MNRFLVGVVFGLKGGRLNCLSGRIYGGGGWCGDSWD